MSVLIKGMEMPESCEKCRMNVAIFLFSDGPIEHCMLLRGRADKRKCPLVPVQAPHGRLIDADALMGQIEHDTPLSAVFEKTMRRYLHNAPTIIEAEVDDGA